MPSIAYEKWNPRGESAQIVSEARSIVADYAAQGYTLTLRQIYYQFVARDLLANNQANYKRLGNMLDRARLAGLLDWNSIVDRTRNLSSQPHWRSVDSLLQGAANGYGNDLWRNQPRRVEIWVEKEALADVVDQAASRWDCSWFACRGYVSQSEMWSAGQRIGRYVEAGQAVTIVHLGDHDPSGIDMTRDITDRLNRFVGMDYLRKHRGEISGANLELVKTYDDIQEWMGQRTGASFGFEVDRIALNMDQIEAYNPPPNFAKLTDSRAQDYIETYGENSWELDALDPRTLDTLIENAITARLDRDLYDAAVESQEDDRGRVREIADAYPNITIDGA